MTDLQRHADVLSAVWRSQNRQLAERFGRSLKKARAELGGGNYSAIVRRAWAVDPNLRGEFGAAISSGLRAMWSNPDTRAAQSERIRQSYTPKLRKLRSEALKLRHARGRAGEQPNKEAAA
jgi:hypothetical protein